VSHNPLDAELAQMASELENLRARRREVTSGLDWYSTFDRAAAEQKVAKLRARRDEVSDQLSAATAEVDAAPQRAAALHAQTRWGRDPRNWFSNHRAQAKDQLAAHTRQVDQLKTHQAELQEDLDRTRRKLKKTKRTISRYDEFDPAAANAEVVALDADIPVREGEHDELAERKQRLDQLLEGAVESLTELQTELSRAKSKRGSLRSDADRYERDIEKAKKLDKALSDAWDGRGRYEVHQECEDAFGDSKPRRVMGDRRRKLDEARREISNLDRRIPSIERNAAKAEQRVATIVARGTREVVAIVIDGNNLCYVDKKFIGIAALRPLCLILQESYDVTLVFDASIRRLLSGSDDENNWLTDDSLRRRFPGVTLHVVPARSQADETILAASVDPFVYVLSNDRFAEFRDKPAVRDKRLIAHEILNDRVLVHDLDISLTIAPGA